MSKSLRTFFAILTILVAVVMLALSIFALTIPSVGMFIVCLMIAAGAGFFVYRDYQFFFGDKSDANTQ